MKKGRPKKESTVDKEIAELKKAGKMLDYLFKNNHLYPSQHKQLIRKIDIKLSKLYFEKFGRK